MIASTHIAFGLFFSLLLTTVLGFQLALSWPVYLFAFLGAVLPDIDHPSSYIGRIFWFVSRPLDQKFGHRTVTHSLLGLAVVAVLSAPLLLLKKEYYFFLVLAYLSHILIDCANLRGIYLFWPSRRLFVWGKSAVRLRSGDPKEFSLSLLFIFLAFLTLPLSHYGLTTSLGFLLGNHRSADSIMLRTENQVYLDFEAVNTLTRKKVSGKALILDRVSNKYFIIVYNDQIYSIGDYGNVDLLSTRERIDYTDKPEDRYQKNIIVSSYAELLAQLPKNCYLKGTICYPETYSLLYHDIFNERISNSDNRLYLEFVSRDELAALAWSDSAASSFHDELWLAKLLIVEL